MTAPAEVRELAVAVVHSLARSVGEPTPIPALADERLNRPDVASEIVAAAMYHGVLPLLWAAVDRGKTAAALHAAAHDAYLSLVARGLKLDYLLKLTDEALTTAGVPYAVYKGPAVARRYPSPAMRAYSDIDVLINRRDIGRADTALRAVGLTGGWAGVAETYAETAYQMSGMGLVDLHWHVMREGRVRAAFALDVEAMLERARRDPSAGNLLMLDEADEVIAVATHACFDGAYRLGWFVDVARLIMAPGLDPDELRRRCAQSGTSLAVQVILDRAARADLLPMELLLVRGAWRRALSWMSALRPVERTFRQAGRGGLAYRATRSTSARSLAALASISVREGVVPLLRDRDHRWRTGRNVRF